MVKFLKFGIDMDKTKASKNSQMLYLRFGASINFKRCSAMICACGEDNNKSVGSGNRFIP